MHALPSNQPALLAEVVPTLATDAALQFDELDGWHNPEQTLTSFSWVCYCRTDQSDSWLPTAA